MWSEAASSSVLYAQQLFKTAALQNSAKATMSEAKKRSRKDSDEVLPLRGGKAAASDHKGVGDAPALGKAISVAPPPAAPRHASMARVGAVVAAAISAAAVSTTAAPPVRHQPADQAKQPSATSFVDMLRAEFRKRQIEVPSRFAADDMSMQAVVHLAETLYVDEILKETSGNVSLAGKIAKITRANLHRKVHKLGLSAEKYRMRSTQQDTLQLS